MTNEDRLREPWKYNEDGTLIVHPPRPTEPIKRKKVVLPDNWEEIKAKEAAELDARIEQNQIRAERYDTDWDAINSSYSDDELDEILKLRIKREKGHKKENPYTMENVLDMVKNDITDNFARGGPDAYMIRFLEQHVDMSKKLAKELVNLRQDYKSKPIPDVYTDNDFEKVAGLLEKLSEDQRNQLTFMREAYYLKIKYNAPYLPPVATYGTPIPITYDKETQAITLTAPLMLSINTPNGAHFLSEKIYYAIKDFSKAWEEENDDVLRYGTVGVIFNHHFKKENARSVKDFDNLEKKTVLNALQGSFIFSDHPNYLISVEAAQLSDKNETEIIIVPIKKLEVVFSEILSRRT